MPRSTIRIVVSASACLLVIIAAVVCLRQAGNFLYLNDPLPKKLDILVTFAEEPERLQYSRALYDHYPMSRWIVSFQDSSLVRQFLPQPIDSMRITLVQGCRHTSDEIRFVKEWLCRNKAGFSDASGKASIGFVSSPYHERRIRMLARKAGYQGCSLLALPVPLADYRWQPDFFSHWWKYPGARAVVWDEFGRCWWINLTLLYRKK